MEKQKKSVFMPVCIVTGSRADVQEVVRRLIKHKRIAVFDDHLVEHVTVSSFMRSIPVFVTDKVEECGGYIRRYLKYVESDIKVSGVVEIGERKLIREIHNYIKEVKKEKQYIDKVYVMMKIGEGTDRVVIRNVMLLSDVAGIVYKIDDVKYLNVPYIETFVRKTDGDCGCGGG